MNSTDNSKLRIIPLGGLEAIGMNITAFEYEDSIVVVDCGLSFPTEDEDSINIASYHLRFGRWPYCCHSG